jgi:hypothetical protein
MTDCEKQPVIVFGNPYFSGFPGLFHPKRPLSDVKNDQTRFRRNSIRAL